MFSHGGLIPGFASYNSYYPDQRLTLIMLSNVQTFAENEPQMADEVESAMIGHAM